MHRPVSLHVALETHPNPVADFEALFKGESQTKTRLLDNCETDNHHIRDLLNSNSCGSE
jgi:hypothetical protein